MVDPSPIKRSKMMCLPLEELDYKNRTFIPFSYCKLTASFSSYSLLRQRLGNRNGNGDGHADHRVVARALFNITDILDSHFSLSGMHFLNCVSQKNVCNFENWLLNGGKNFVRKAPESRIFGLLNRQNRQHYLYIVLMISTDCIRISSV